MWHFSPHQLVNLATPAQSAKVVAPSACNEYNSTIPTGNTTMEIEVAVSYDADGEKIMAMLPAKFIVCPECEGHGTVLNDSMRGHCYTAEEFHDIFDNEDDRAAYFERGGRYDVQCPNCKGKNVVLVVDDDACVTAEQKQTLKWHNEWYDDLVRGLEQDRQTMRGESGIFD